MFRNAYGGWTTWARNFKKGFCIWMSALRMTVYLETFISLNGPYKMGTKNRRMNKEEKKQNKTLCVEVAIHPRQHTAAAELYQ